MPKYNAKILKKTLKNRSKTVRNQGKSMENRLEIDAKMMIRLKIAFWRHLGLPKPPKIEFGRPPRAMAPFDLFATLHRGV